MKRGMFADMWDEIDVARVMTNNEGIIMNIRKISISLSAKGIKQGWQLKCLVGSRKQK